MSRVLYSNALSLPTTRASPCPEEKTHGEPNTNSHGPEGGRIACLAMAKDVFWVFFNTSLGTIRGFLVHSSVHGAPEGSACSRRHGQNAPVCSKVLDAPDDRDNDGSEGKYGTITCADEGGNNGEARSVVLNPACCEQELSEGEEESECYKESDARHGELSGLLRRREG